MLIRREEPRDAAKIRELNDAAFETTLEADIVDAVRTRHATAISLVAESNGEIVGHILFSPVTLAASESISMMGLGPMAVAPAKQRQGIGSALVRAGLEACREQRCAAVVVVGHPNYYPRFGFEPASRYRIRCEYDVPDEVFMLIELAPGALTGRSGKVAYDAAFDGA